MSPGLPLPTLFSPRRRSRTERPALAFAPVAEKPRRSAADIESIPIARENMTTPAVSDPLAALARLREARTKLERELAKVIVGQHDVIEQILIAIFTRSHAVLVGVPGLAKTLLVSSLARTLHLSFKRIQFTPDLMPTDITGTEVIFQDPVTAERGFKFLPGPIFANVILADEINRTPPKTQAAMLEAMQERKVTAGGTDYVLPDPFFVLATQNPLEQEGTYPLPEAQLDRFLFMITVDYPSSTEELEIMRRGTTPGGSSPEAVLTAEEIVELQGAVKRIPIADHIYHYAEKLVRSTRPKDPTALDFCRKWLSWGAGPRASLGLVIAARARALLRGESCVSCADVAAVAAAVMRHRLGPNFAAQSDGVTADEIVHRIIAAIPQH